MTEKEIEEYLSMPNCSHGPLGRYVNKTTNEVAYAREYQQSSLQYLFLSCQPSVIEINRWAVLDDNFRITMSQEMFEENYEAFTDVVNH